MKISKYAFETIVGSIVIIISISFLMKIIFSGNMRSVKSDGMQITAKFNNVDGIEVGSDIKISGVKVGVVTEKSLDYETYRAILKFSIDKAVKIPLDSNAAVVSSGLLGGKYIDIRPGSEENYIQENGKISYTQSSINLEELIGKFAFGGQSKK